MRFLELGREVLLARDVQGVRGIVREQSRFTVHLADSPLAEKDVATLSTRDVREWDRWMAVRMAKTKGKQPPRKLSKATISRCRSLASVIMREAVERELRTDNPFDLVKVPKRVDERDAQEKWDYLRRPEQLAILSCAAIPEETKLVMAFAWGTGARHGEQFNLELADLVVDGEDPHAMLRFSNRHKGAKAPTKSGKVRKVPLMGETLGFARRWLELLPTFAPNNPHGLVFPSRNGKHRLSGKPLGRTTSVRDVYELAGIARRPHLYWHSLRHTFASNLITGALGRRWSLDEIRVLMGHATSSMTEKYAHLGEDAIKVAVREANAASQAAAESRTEIPPPAPTARVAWLFALWTLLCGLFRARRAPQSEGQVRDAA